MEKRGAVIAIGGPPGSGKTTYAIRIAERLGFEYKSAGMIFREMSSELGVSLIDLNRMAEEEKWIDYYVDRKSLEAAMKGNIVIEGHLVPWIVQSVADLKIYFYASINTRVKRIASREGRDEKEVLFETAQREYSHALRFRKLYGIDITDLSIYDLVVNTDSLSIEEVNSIVDRVVELYERKMANGAGENKFTIRR
ncbi:MAG: AAA family ATPase [Desulfurococcales archaeon]